MPWRLLPSALVERGSSWWTEDGTTLTIGWAAYAEYLVHGPPQASVRVTLGSVSQREAAMGFVFSVLPLSLPLFALEPFHGAVVAAGGDAVAILGPTGAGKSTTARAAAVTGSVVLSDDVCAIGEDGLVVPGAPMYTLRQDETDPAAIGRYQDKEILLAGDHDSTPRLLAGTVVLEPGPSERLAAVRWTGGEALTALLRHVRAPWCFAELRRAAQLRAAAEIARKPVVSVRFRPGRDRPEEVARVAMAAVLG